MYPSGWALIYLVISKPFHSTALHIFHHNSLLVPDFTNLITAEVVHSLGLVLRIIYFNDTIFIFNSSIFLINFMFSIYHINTNTNKIYHINFQLIIIHLVGGLVERLKSGWSEAWTNTYSSTLSFSSEYYQSTAYSHPSNKQHWLYAYWSLKWSLNTIF